MADTLQTQALIELATKFAPEIVRQSNRASVALMLLESRQGINASGPNIAAEQTGANAEETTEGADVTSFGSDSQSAAVLAWAMERATFHVSDEAMSRAVIAGNPSGNIALWARNMLNAVDAMCSKINGLIYTGSSGIIGFDSAIGSTSNTYAGIDRSQAANAYWRPSVFDTGSLTTITQKLITQDLANIAILSNRRPNIALCNPLTFAAVENTFNVQRQFFTMAANGIQQSFLGDVALPYLSIHGTRFVEDKDGYGAANNGTIYYLNSQHARIEYVPYQDVNGFMTSTVSGGAQVPGVPLAMQFVPLAKAGNSSKAMVRCQLQLVVDRPNACGVRKNLNIA